MAIPRERRSLPRAPAGRTGGFLPAARTPSGIESPDGRGVRATPPPRSAHRAAALALLGAGLVACDPYIEGNGVFLQEHRDAVAFVGVHVEDGIQAFVASRAAAQDVRVSSDANVVPHIRTEVKQDGGRNVLHVYVDERFGATIAPRVEVDAPAFEYVLATQGSRVRVQDAATATFTVTADQGSVVEVAGPSGSPAAGESISVELASGAALDASEYPVTQSASVSLSGASATIRCAGPVTGRLANGSTLENVGGGDCSGLARDPSSHLDCP